MVYFAHSKLDENGQLLPKTEWQTLDEHLANVASRAGEFAAVFDSREWGETAGRLHDIGKATKGFQRRLEGSAEKVDHSTAGAFYACEHLDESGGLLSFLIAGHHGGLPNAIVSRSRSSMKERFERYAGIEKPASDVARVRDNLPDPLENLPKHKCDAGQGFSFYLFEKMVYSCLVDADYLDTEAFVDASREHLRRSLPESSMINLLHMYEEYMLRLSNKAEKSAVNDARNSILSGCLDAAENSPGIFTLTVPTGGGKTLASLGFALNHAVRNGQRRIIIAIPFTSIVEQTAAILKNIFGSGMVIEHHSNYDFGETEDGVDSSAWERLTRERLATENWDAPIIVTTNVQFFESLYAAKPSRCRKLHNIARSVVILDEAQTLPDRLLLPSLAMLEDLNVVYGTSIVLCTATQPALETRWPFEAEPREILPQRDDLVHLFGSRTQITNIGKIDFDELVERICENRQALCIVGSRKAARIVYEKVTEALESKEGIHHLSALMVPEHRSSVFKEIRDELRQGSRCITISTQLIEAGVDVDFPIVFREMAGLDSIMQAAGRCNREGKREQGPVLVFETDFETTKRKRLGWLDQMKALGRESISANANSIDDNAVRRFFERRYQVANLDEKEILSELIDINKLCAQESGFGLNYRFEDYASDYKIIDDSGVAVFVPWGAHGRELLEGMETEPDIRCLSRKLQRYTVSIPEWTYKEYIRAGAIDESKLPFHVLVESNGAFRFYQDDIGLLPVGEEEMELLIM